MHSKLQVPQCKLPASPHHWTGRLGAGAPLETTEVPGCYRWSCWRTPVSLLCLCHQTIPWCWGQTVLLSCAVLHCHMQLQPDDTFKPPSSTTSLLANWQFLLQATAMYQACLVSRGENCTMLMYASLTNPIVNSSQNLSQIALYALPWAPWRQQRLSLMVCGSCSDLCQPWHITRP